MQISSVNNNQPHFNGTVKNTHLFQNYAMEYAKSIKVSDPDWAKLKIFINTIRAIKADKSADEFIIDTTKASRGQLWFLKYGDYIRQGEYFKSELYHGKSYGHSLLEEDAFKKVVEFGKEYFGNAKVCKPIEEFVPANRYLKNAGKFISASRQDKNRFVKEKLLENARREEKKANDAIATIRMAVLDNLQ